MSARDLAERIRNAVETATPDEDLDVECYFASSYDYEPWFERVDDLWYLYPETGELMFWREAREIVEHIPYVPLSKKLGRYPLTDTFKKHIAANDPVR